MKSLFVSITFFCFSILNLSAQTITFPDANFQNALLTHWPAIDINNDGLIQISEIENLTSLYVAGKSISDLSGLEAFPKLVSLNCSNNSLSHIDLSHNPELKFLELGWNSISNIDLSKSTKLQVLGLQDNGLTSIDVTSNKDLRELKVEYNALTQLDVSENRFIWYLNFSDNQISTINLNPIRSLSVLSAGNNLLTSLNLSCHTNLSYVTIDNNSLLNSVCLNSSDYAERMSATDPNSAYWTKSSNTAWANCPSLPLVTPIPATIVPINLCETGDMTFNAVSEQFISNPTYRWQKANSAAGPWVSIPGAINQSLVLTNLQMSDNGSIYKVLISSTDYCGTGHMEEAAGQIILHPAVYPKVTASASVSGAICDNALPITYTATPVAGQGSAPAYQWYYYNNPGFTAIAGATDIQYTPAVLPPDGTQLFAGMFTDEMCAVESGVASNILTVAVVPAPEPVITTSDIALCNPSGYVIQTSHTAATGTQFQWYRNGIALAGSNVRNLTIPGAGTYYMTEDNGTCTTASGTVTISTSSTTPDPQVNVSSSLTGAACDTLQKITYTATPVAGTVTAPTYQWYNAVTDTPISGATDAVYTPAAKPMNGDQVYVQIHTNEACVANPDVKSITVTTQILTTPAPLITSGNTALCNPSGYVIQTSQTAATGTQFQWFRNGSALTGSNTPTLTIASEGTYYLVEDNGTCKISSGSVTISAIAAMPDPQVNISSSLTGTACDTLQKITYTATPVAGTVTTPTYQWYNAATDTPISGATDAVYTPAAKPVNGDKVYVQMHSAATCVAHPDVTSATLTAHILTTPAPVMLSRDTAICMPQEYKLSAKLASGTQIQWYKNGTPITGSSHAAYTIHADELSGGSYHVSESNGACTIHADAVNIELMHTPLLYTENELYVSKGERVTLNVQAEHAAYHHWSPAIGLSNPDQLITEHLATNSVTYTLHATNQLNKCPVSTEVTIRVKAEVIIPNVITVNGDGVNDTWEIENIENFPQASIEIFNRWGNMVWKSIGYSNQWNGSSRNGEPLPAGTYYYIVNLNSKQQTDAYTGYIQLVE
jgi:gliding motility-associated-like protein